jgi:cyclopropane fatty-acyl-phospholipid synthase-like methyltransferase
MTMSTSADQDLDALRARVSDLEVALAQVESILHREAAGAPPPPKHMQIRVVGGYVPAFIESGYSICDDLDGVLKFAGRELKEFQRILDWGCGCGRTTRALRMVAPASELHGADIDDEAINWLRQNCSRYADFRLAPHRPPMPYADGTFDLIIGISVFTHLPEDMQFLWLDELRRITKPGGLLILSTSGENNYKQLPPKTLATIHKNGYVYIDGEYGQSINLPAFYQNAFHSCQYIRNNWSKYFRVLDIQPARMQRHQDAVLLEKAPFGN